MTTLTWDGATLASDSRSTRKHRSHGTGRDHCVKCDSTIDRTVKYRGKVHAPRDKLLFFKDQQIIAWAHAGTVPVTDVMTYALQKGVDLSVAVTLAYKGMGESPKDVGLLLIVTTETVWEVETIGLGGVTIKEITDVPYAIGSGSPAAMVAMKRMGLSAPAAVGIAIDVDIGSGGEVCYIDCRSPLNQDEKREVKYYTYTNDDIAEFFK